MGVKISAILLVFEIYITCYKEWQKVPSMYLACQNAEHNVDLYNYMEI